MTTTADGILNQGHDDRLVQRIAADGADVIRKRYQHADAVEVFDAMTDLWRSPLGAGRVPPGLPRPLGLHADRHGMDMACIDGRMLGERGDVGFLPQRLSDVADLLADLHSSGVVVPRRRTAAKLVTSLRRKFADEPHAVVEHLAGIAPQLAETVVVSHGDFSPRNIVVGAQGLVLIDFDRLQMAGPGRDVNHLGAWCWATIALGRDRSGVDAWDLCHAFEAAYLAHRPEAASDVVAGRSFHRATGLLRIATEWSAVTSDPTIQRRVLDEATRVARLTN